MKRVVGLVLLILGLSWLLLSVLNFTITDTVVDTAFVLEPGEKYGPMEKGTVFCTRGIPVLTGEVSVEGEGIYFSVQGWDYLFERIFVDSYFNFTIDPANIDCYFFTFDNSRNAESHVEFVLEETLTESLTLRFARSLGGYYGTTWISSLLGAFLLLPIAFILTFGSLLSKKKEKSRSRARDFNGHG